MKIRTDIKQGTPEWLEARLGIPTASEWDAIITPLGAKRESAGVRTYLYTKLAERWLQTPLGGFDGGAVEQGKILEEEALPWFEFEHNVEVARPGFITTDDERIGCSPDGWIEADGIGLEIKCPEPHTHVGYLLENKLPKAYFAQVMGSMLVTSAPRWNFLSYCRGFPPLVLTVERDEKACEVLKAALDEFCDRLDESYTRLRSMKGGPLPPLNEPVAAKEDSAVVAWLKGEGV